MMRYRLKSGGSIGYSPAGTGDIAVVFLHPVGLKRDLWTPVAAALAEDCRTLTIDLPGHGESDIPSGRITMQGMADAVAEMIEAVGGPRVVVCGCSMGSAVAVSIAAKPSAKTVVGLITSNSGHHPSPDRHKSLTQRATEARRGMVVTLETTLKRWFTYEYMSTHADVVAPVRSWLLDGDPIVHGWCWEALRDFDYGPLFEKIALPMLAIGSALDQSAKPEHVKALADGFADGAYANIEGAGHISPLEAPAEYAALVRTFLSRLR
jgi:3-oxoadipate enol-lactonase